MNRCPFAVQIPDLVPDEPRGVPVFGLCVHTSGRGVLKKAAQYSMSPIEAALAYYQSAEFSSHYVIDYDGATYQITADDRRVSHVGLTPEARGYYLNGRWKTMVSQVGLATWTSRWGRVASPAGLYPSRYPNSDYVGAECLPRKETLTDSSADWYTDSQYEAVARLAIDLARRHRWPGLWSITSRLLGHEDLSPLTRWDRSGGWDPGARRPKPRFSWAAVRSVTETRP